jgi:hypothetical protein
MSRRTRPALALAALLALAAGACGGDDAEVASEGDGDTASAADEMDEMQEAFSNTPLSQLLGMGGDPEEMEQQFSEQQRQIEAAVAACMAEQGFEYVPVDPTAYTSFEGSWPGSDLSPREYAEQYGYGISTTLFEDMGGPPVSEEMPEDPNMAIVEAMSEGEREAYYTALYGETPEYDPTAEDQEIEFEGPSGCYGEAYDTVPPDPYTAVYEELGDELTDLYERQAADPRIIALDEAWLSCMSDAGYPFEMRQDPYDEISNRMTPIYDALYASAPTEPTTDAGGDDTIMEMPTGMPGMDDLTAAQREQLESIQEYEKAVAVADYDCGQDDWRVYLEVRTELEQEFVDTYGDQITALTEGGN